MSGGRRSLWLHALILLLLLAMAGWWGATVTRAGGPLLVGGGPPPTGATGFGVGGVPFAWSTTSPVPYRTDLGGLGTLDKAQADQFTRDSFDAWQNVTTAAIAYTKAGDLAQDVNGANVLSLRDNPSSDFNTTNAIVYDTDGTVTDALLGAGASNNVLGFAGPLDVSSDGVKNFITRARAVLNGKFIDGINLPSNPEVSLAKFREAIIHEFGHFSGLDHSQINVEVLDPAQRTADNLAGLPNMFPFLLGGSPARPSLAPDDVAAISLLYPEASLATSLGRIRGRIFFSDGTTPAQGVNVIARQVDDPATPQDESRRIAVSSVSGFLFTACVGNPVSTPGDCGPITIFGSRDTSLIGFYDIPGLPAGDYTVEVEAIDPDFIGGSRVGPIGDLGFQFPLPGPAEFYSGPGEAEAGSSALDPPDSFFVLTVSAASVRDNIDIILNDTLPGFDAWESAWWRRGRVGQLVAWLRRVLRGEA